MALEIGTSAAYLSDLYHARRDPGPIILDYLGLEKHVERVVTYTRRRR